MHPDDKLVRDPKFLKEIRAKALMNKDVTVPDNDSELYQPLMWTLGVMQTLWAQGYEIKKKE